MSNNCKICYAIDNQISMIETNPSTLCPKHYQEWSDEKNLGEYFG